MRTTQKQFSIRTALLFFVMACAAYGADRMYGTNRMVVGNREPYNSEPSGRVETVLPSGVIVWSQPGGYLFFLSNAPESIRAEGRLVDCHSLGAREMGTIKVQGRVLTHYDFGREPTAAELKKWREEEAEAAEKMRVKQMAAANQAREIAEARARETLIRVIANQLKQASNGSPTFQLELGKRYMSGDGVETNLALARHWLQSACTNHESGASNLLERLRQMKP